MAMDSEGIDQIIRELKDKYRRKASLVVPVPDMKAPSRTTTWLGNVFLKRPNETWPERNNRPMVGLCQLNLREAPYLPDDLKDLDMITVFVPASGEDYPPFDFEFDSVTCGIEEGSIVVRSYWNLDELVEYDDAPSVHPYLKPCPCVHRVIDDYPHNPVIEWFRLENRGIDRQAVEKIQDGFDGGRLDEQWETKLGGYASPLQDPTNLPITFQIGSNAVVNMDLIDRGSIYFWRRYNGLWDMDMQFM